MLRELGWEKELGLEIVFSAADLNHDGSLSLDEFAAFYSTFSSQAQLRLVQMATMSHVGGVSVHAAGDPCNPATTAVGGA